jgi:hypothetical protein
MVGRRINDVPGRFLKHPHQTTMRRIFVPVAFASMALFGVSAEARNGQVDPGLRHAQTLVNQGHAQLQATHRRHPHGYGGHDVKAERLLRRAARELSQAELYRKYNPGNT